jgi:L-alanine-DL-glutamate epimerase-like enolase superfamily enzyme
MKLKLQHETCRWTMTEPFIIAGHRYDYIDAVQVTLHDEQGNSGRGESCGVDYHGETADSIRRSMESCREPVEAGVSLAALQGLLPAGGARNALDCALWDLQCQRDGHTIWQQLAMDNPIPTPTAYTIGLVDPIHATELAQQYHHYQTLKIKADHRGSLPVLRAVRSTRADARIIIDANQSWSLELLQQLEPELLELGIALLEQPLAVTADNALAAYDGSLKLAADESIHTCADLPALVGKYHTVNIKLDKTGGLSEALKLASQARALGFDLMVGNMCGSSLAMAPAYVIAQFCEYVDIDGPLLQTDDIEPPLQFTAEGVLPSCSKTLWAGI